MSLEQDLIKQLERAPETEILGLKNELWLAEGEAEANRTEFECKMVLESIKVEPDGSFEFWHNGGDLFRGHSIMVSGNLEEGPNDAGIHG